MLDNIQNIFYEQFSSISLDFKRYMHQELDMNDKLIGIIGARGVGKTTFILQYLKELNLPLEKKLYFSADHFYISSKSLYEIAEYFYKRGGEVLAIDEIHKYKNYEQELKSIYDSFSLKVIFSGSSALQINNAKYDLSRRAVLHKVQGLSFREFIEFETGTIFKSFSLEELLQNHIQIAFDIKQKIRPYEYFEKYLRYGYYPFYKQNKNLYTQKLNEVLNTVLESDLPIVFNIEPKNIFKLKKLLSLLCQSKPYELNISKLAQKIEINRATLYNYLHYLEVGDITKIVSAKTKGDAIFSKPEKLYLNNTNLSYNYCQNSDIGTIREQFFVNQLSLKHNIKYSKIGDFLVDEKYIFEIGGAKKSFNQIKDTPDSFIVADNIEVGSSGKIPLWLFGFLY
jgi:predicted AAA+ superfamily ATPase